MKDKIAAESDRGHGSYFSLAWQDGTQTVEGSGSTSETVSRPRVLVVEDNADTRTLLYHLLRKSYEVVCTSGGEEALSSAHETSYDVLLVDINLGHGPSGEEILHEIKQLPRYENTPVIAVTAYAMPGDRARFSSEGFDDYVSKPFSRQRLLEALEGALK